MACITECCPLKGVAWEKRGTYDASRVQQPVNEVAKATTGFDTATVGAISVEMHFHLKRPYLYISTEHRVFTQNHASNLSQQNIKAQCNVPLEKIQSSLHFI